MIVKTNYNDGTTCPYFRGMMDIIIIFYFSKKRNLIEHKNVENIRKVIILNSVISFIYHKIKLSNKSEYFIAVLDNYLISFRTFIISNHIQNKGENIRKIAFFLSTVFLLDHKHYVKNNYCILPFISAVLHIENIHQLKVSIMYACAFFFYVLEYFQFQVFGVDPGSYLRNNQYISNHEIFHIMLFITELLLLKSGHFNSEKGNVQQQ